MEPGPWDADRPRGRSGRHRALGEIYVAGGANSDGGRDAHSLGRVEVYQPATNRWVCVLHIPTRRRFPAAAAAAGRIYVMGGYTASAGFLARVEAYVPPSRGAAC